MKVSTLLYPSLLECVDYTDDFYWKDVFENMAYGITPRNTYISRGFLCSSLKKKNFSYKITDDSREPPELTRDIIHLLSLNLGMYSEKDKLNIIKKIEDDKQTENDTWNSIKKKSVREILIEMFISEMKSEYSLSIQQSRELLKFIQISLIFKTITSEDIHLINGKIKEIEGISFSNKNYNIERDLFSDTVSEVEECTFEKTKVFICDEWKKFLEKLSK